MDDPEQRAYRAGVYMEAEESAKRDQTLRALLDPRLPLHDAVDEQKQEKQRGGDAEQSACRAPGETRRGMQQEGRDQQCKSAQECADRYFLGFCHFMRPPRDRPPILPGRRE